jgi:hypothetical protein
MPPTFDSRDWAAAFGIRDVDSLVADADPDIEWRRAVVGGLEAPSNAVERASDSSSPT